MAEYIKRKALLTDICDDMCGLKYAGVCENCRVVALIADTPAVDVAPVVHGRWVYHDDGVITCSECGNAESSDSYYCRYCGAKMDGGAE